MKGKGEGGGEDAAIFDVGFYIFDWRGDCSRPAVPGHAHACKGRQAPTLVRGAEAGRKGGIFNWGRDVKEARFRDEVGMEVASGLRI